MRVFIHGFWHKFLENSLPLPVTFYFFELLLSKVFNEKIEIGNLENSDVLLESLFSDTTFLYHKKWKHSILFNGESIYRTVNIILYKNRYRLQNIDKYSCRLSGRFTDRINKIVNVPYFIPYIYSNNYLDILQNTNKNIKNVPKKGLCAIISNGECTNFTRNKILDKLDKIFKIDYAGHYRNNVPLIPGSFNSIELFRFISQYKFVIAIENTKQEIYITEKIINGVLSNVIPIYWGSDNITDYFNETRFINIINDSDEVINNAAKNIFQIMDDENKYLEIVNSPIFKNEKLNRTIDDIAEDIKETIM
jgi:hypothetical protein